MNMGTPTQTHMVKCNVFWDELNLTIPHIDPEMLRQKRREGFETLHVPMI